MVEFTVPGPVRGKGRPRASARGGFARMYTDAKTRSYESDVKLFASQAMAGLALIDGPVMVTMTAHFETPKSASKKKRAAMLSGAIRPTKKPDTDNIAKIKDALNGVVWHDDAQVVTETITKIFAEAPSLHVVVQRVLAEAS